MRDYTALYGQQNIQNKWLIIGARRIHWKQFPCLFIMSLVLYRIFIPASLTPGVSVLDTLRATRDVTRFPRVDSWSCALYDACKIPEQFTLYRIQNYSVANSAVSYWRSCQGRPVFKVALTSAGDAVHWSRYQYTACPHPSSSPHLFCVLRFCFFSLILCSYFSLTSSLFVFLLSSL